MFCLTIGSLASTIAACSSDEKPPRSASYSDGTTNDPAPPFRPDLNGDGNQDPAPAAPTRDRPTPDSDDVQAGSEGIFGGTSNATRDAGASDADAGSDAGADAGD